MKELSIEEKAARYDEILARAEGANLPYYKEDIMSKVKEFVDYLLPELKESEDEKTRRAIIATIHLYYGEPLEDEAKEMISWIEKQGEQKPIVIIPKFRVGDIIRCSPLYDCDKTMHITSIDERGYNVDYQHLGDNTTIGTIGFAFENDYELVESRLTESGKINLIKMIIEYFRTGVMPDLPQRVKIVNFLKSLTDRVGCEANCTTMWKPSEEQIRRLEYFLKLWGKTEDIENTKVFETVKSLLNDLKKLREE